MKKLFTLLTLALCSLLFTCPIYATSITHASFTTMGFVLESSTTSYEAFAIEVDGVRYFTLSTLATVLNDTPTRFNFKWVPEKRMIEIEKGVTYEGNALTNLPTSFIPSQVQPTQVTLSVNDTPYVLKAVSYHNTNYFNPSDLTPLVDCRFSAQSNNRIITIFPNLAYRQIQSVDPTIKNAVNGRLPVYSNRWAYPVLNSAFVDDTNAFNTVNLGDALYITTYDANLKTVQIKKAAKELPLWGGFYKGSHYSFSVTGQSNKEEDNKKEVIRIVKYDEDLNPIGTLSITGGMCFTTVPFNAGSLRMQEIGNKLIIHTSRERYKSSDGFNHQSQLTLILDIDKMKLLNSLELFQPNHVSHSFDQFVLKDGSKHVLLDHGDAYPRSIVLHAETNSGYSEVDLFDIPGQKGANCTGVSVGGFQMSKDYYITAFSTIDHSLATSYNSYSILGAEKDQRHIMVSAVPKNNLSSNGVKQKMIIDYTGTHKTAGAPYLIKLSDEHFALLWQEEDADLTYSTIRYVCLDHQGNPCTPIGSLYGILSYAEPVLYNDTLTWFVKDLESTLIYQMPVEMILPN